MVKRPGPQSWRLGKFWMGLWALVPLVGVGLWADTGLETKTSWAKRRQLTYSRSFCQKLGAQTNRSVSPEGADEILQKVNQRFSLWTARGLGLDLFKPQFVKAEGRTVHYKLNQQTIIYGCRGEDFTPLPEFVPEVTCTSRQELEAKIREMKESIAHVAGSQEGLAGSQLGTKTCPDHLALSEKEEEGCINPCSNPTPLNVGASTSSQQVGDGPVTYETTYDCQACPKDFPAWDEDKLDCTNADGCTRSEGSYELPYGKVVCGMGCPTGWKVLANGDCELDYQASCQRCDQINRELSVMINPLRVPDDSREEGSSEAPSPPACSQLELDQFFHGYQVRAKGRVDLAQAQCWAMATRRVVVASKDLAKLDMQMDPCVGIMFEVAYGYKMRHTAAQEMHCRFDSEIDVNAPTLDDWTNDNERFMRR